MASLVLLIDTLLPRKDLLYFSWATCSATALLVLDISTEMGEYFRLVPERKRLVTKTTLHTVGMGLLVIFGVGVAIGILTHDGMDPRMYAILEGLSRLEAAVIFFTIAIETPKWVGLFHSASATSYLAGRALVVAQDDSALVKLVQWSLVHRFVMAYLLILPFVGKAASVIVGALLGFVIDILLYLTRRAPRKTKIALCTFLTTTLTLASCFFFAAACRYIQTVWDIRYIPEERALVQVAFGIWLFSNLCIQFFFYRDTRNQLRLHQRFSTAARGDRLATSLIIDKVLQRRLMAEILNTINEPTISNDAFDDEEEEDIVDDAMVTDYSTELEVVYRWIQRSVWGLAASISILLVVANIGASSQMKAVRERLPLVDAILYDHINDMAVCGLNVTTRKVKTFQTPEEAHAENYGVAHCGECGACSNWHNLKLQYTTRHYLAAESAKCARKSLIGGREAALECLETNPLISFESDCAQCWTDDILCSKDKCVFIFLQSTFINKISNFEVSSDDVTSATCEEAMCEFKFVPCSGATRRRMNIHSDITRPAKQQCLHVDFDWEDVFGDDGNSDEGETDIEDQFKLLGATVTPTRSAGISAIAGILIVGAIAIIAQLRVMVQRRSATTSEEEESTPLTSEQKTVLSYH